MSDPSSIARLLDQLSASTAWQSAVVARPVDVGQAPSSVASNNQESDTEIPSKASREDGPARFLDAGESIAVAPSERVNALLDLLGSTPEHGKGLASSSTERLMTPKKSGGPDDQLLKDPRYLSFADALQLVTKLAQNSVTVKHLKEIRDEQNRLEQRYWDSRQELLQKQSKRVEELRTKVSLTGGLGNREIDRLKASFQKELSELEQEEFLPAWDKLLRRQQATLERMKIPLMFETNDPVERRRQQQILNVLEGLMDSTV